MIATSPLSALSLCIAAATATSATHYQPRDVSAACSSLEQSWANVTYYPGNSNYTELNEDYFSADSWLSPACIFAPTTAEQMSGAVQILARTGVSFAMRGGGHMPIANAANINSSGVLLSSSGMTQLQLSKDQSTIEIGAGNKWGQVYEYLEPFKLAVIGGRSGLVGVAGFILGGGISFFGNQYGWASANVAQFDCILANGDFVSATPTNEYSDLYWALRGGGNSFAIVTFLHLKTVSLPEVTIGQNTYNESVSEEFLDYVIGFAHNGSGDSKAALEPMVQSINGQLTYNAIMFYDGANTSPAALLNFTDVMQPVNSTFEVRPSMYNWTQAADPGREALRGLRARFQVITITADRAAVQVLHDTFLEMLESTLANVENLVAALVFVPITEKFLTASTINGGDPMDVDTASAPYLFVEQTFLWSNASDSAKIDSFLETYNANVTAQLSVMDNVLSPYLYLNYADSTQDVFKGYPQDNVLKLQSIRNKYDPNMTFTNQMPGGWKIHE
ncbi:hypothetical protein PFICI_10478 [Pestalotiopsis fici W106-1]|uniref:FAD-binding PCMH-type domain-containing protein n=1 Tax=Pestalotiopsis fici (strain W106-1 / CGMCC3.15140) TaxID=1229662 RepID=W3WZV2_PESFW|nr:uncharacterized protein PFICI_10478 [Pestalotiopsis fici W106-1]ETS78416.1 hypothetical protein PFICI_10478 [Pestalotiopsis fici W106-1]